MGRPRLPTTTTEQTSDELATASANAFLTKFVDADGRVVRHDQGNDTVSEGQAYGMLIAVGIGDKARFDSMWNWSKANLLQQNGLLAWRWQDGKVVDTQGATDADMDIAYALTLASTKFGDAGYADEARNLSKAVLDFDVFYDRDGAPVLMAGPWATASPYYLNPSYISPRVEQALATLTQDARWPQVITRERALLETLMGTGNDIKLPPDWAKLDPSGFVAAAGPPSSPNDEAIYSYDALRTPIRLAFSCNPSDVALAAKMYNVLSDSETPESARFSLDGESLDNNKTSLGAVAIGAAATADGREGKAESYFQEADKVEAAKATYYGAAWAALGRMMFTTDWLDTDCPMATNG